MAITAPQIIWRLIDFPTTQRQIIQKQDDCMQITGFLGVVGVIDCININIIVPHMDEDTFIDRKRYHSINTQCRLYDSWCCSQLAWVFTTTECSVRAASTCCLSAMLFPWMSLSWWEGVPPDKVAAKPLFYDLSPGLSSIITGEAIRPNI